MGPCISNRTNEMLESKVFTEKESSPTGEVVCDFIRADTVPSCISKNLSKKLSKNLTPPSSDESHKKSTSVPWDDTLERTKSTHLLTKPCFQPLTINLSLTPSFSLTSLSSPTTYWRDVGDILSFDGVNQRVCNRYDIGLRMLKAQISYGADPHVLTTHGERSCLMFAVLAEDFKFVKKLVGLGVDVNKTNRFGENALTLALGLERKDIAGYLRTKGALDKR